MRKRVPISLKLDPDRLSRLDVFIETLPYSPTRTGVIEAAIDEFLDRNEKDRKSKRT